MTINFLGGLLSGSELIHISELPKMAKITNPLKYISKRLN